ncbi:MYND-type domain-containing protein [Mycena sanguinolenta]|uniref:MYND-type domain-containing protein n=1 Tax=Mycena sanguinolenta TaxID=230812 RepID=A0A8H6YAY0_9AGAR|nr:MYND-type domain-containing protein [Mycena sanguinolenta]
MPLMEFYAGSNDRCYCCNQPGERKLRTCSRCKVARYCSPQCQKSDWPNHKLNCIDHKTTLKSHPDSTMQNQLKVFLKWIDLWRDALIAWGAFSADLANQSPGYLLNHSYLVEIERLPSNETKRSKFRVVAAGMLSDVQMMAQFDRHPDPEYRADLKQTFRRISPGTTKLRLVIVCFPLYGNFGDLLDNIFPDGKAASFTNPLSPQSRITSTALLHAWRNQFEEHVLAGNVTGHTQVLDNLRQHIQVLAEAALNVD